MFSHRLTADAGFIAELAITSYERGRDNPRRVEYDRPADDNAVECLSKAPTPITTDQLRAIVMAARPRTKAARKKPITDATFHRVVVAARTLGFDVLQSDGTTPLAE